MSPLDLFATCPKGLELLLVDELMHLGATQVHEKLAGVAFQGDLTLAYKVCLWSRLANRVLLKITEFKADTPEALYSGVQSVEWSEHLNAENTFAINFVSSHSTITHTLFGAQKVKDAIVDQFRTRLGLRPNVAKIQPDVSIFTSLRNDNATLYIDLAGESLHKRGYRLAAGLAPLKENVAAAILLRAGWPTICAQGGSLLDPMCGSGTLLIEGALMAADIAPGLLHPYFGFLGWKQHLPKVWADLYQAAEQRRTQGLAKLPAITGFDEDATAIKHAFANIENAGLHGKIHVEKHEVAVFKPKAKDHPGLIVTNPPYGERLGEIEALGEVYSQLGEQLKKEFVGYQAAVLAGNPELGKNMGLRAHKYYTLYNGPIKCQLLLFTIQPEFFVDRSPEKENERRIQSALRTVAGRDTTHIQMFINRLKKNLKHRLRVAKRMGQENFRVYDADLPEYAFAIDIQGELVYVEEYLPAKNVDLKNAWFRQQEVLAALPEVLNITPAKIYFSSGKKLQDGNEGDDHR